MIEEKRKKRVMEMNFCMASLNGKSRTLNNKHIHFSMLGNFC